MNDKKLDQELDEVLNDKLESEQNFSNSDSNSDSDTESCDSCGSHNNSCDNIDLSWDSATSFTELCHLMQEGLFGDKLDPLIKRVDVVDVPYIDDILSLCHLNFLVCDYAIGNIEEGFIENEFCEIHKKSMIHVRTGIKNSYQRQETRNYVSGFIEREKLELILPVLSSNYLVYVCSFIDDEEITLVQGNIEKLEQNKKYLFIPDSYKDDSCSHVLNKFSTINIKRTKYTFGIDIEEELDFNGINIAFENDEQPDFDPYNCLDEFNPDLAEWIRLHTYYVTVINPVYGVNGIFKTVAISLLSTMQENDDEINDQDHNCEDDHEDENIDI